MSAKHTPGPWNVLPPKSDIHHGGYVGVPDDDYAYGVNEVAYVTPQSSSGTHEANARLIAAAPEMLEALEGVAKNINPDDWFERVHAAIAKAKGRV